MLHDRHESTQGSSPIQSGQHVAMATTEAPDDNGTLYLPWWASSAIPALGDVLTLKSPMSQTYPLQVWVVQACHFFPLGSCICTFSRSRSASYPGLPVQLGLLLWATCSINMLCCCVCGMCWVDNKGRGAPTLTALFGQWVRGSESPLLPAVCSGREGGQGGQARSWKSPWASASVNTPGQ